MKKDCIYIAQDALVIKYAIVAYVAEYRKLGKKWASVLLRNPGFTLAIKKSSRTLSKLLGKQFQELKNLQ